MAAIKAEMKTPFCQMGRHRSTNRNKTTVKIAGKSRQTKTNSQPACPMPRKRSAQQNAVPTPFRKKGSRKNRLMECCIRHQARKIVGASRSKIADSMVCRPESRSLQRNAASWDRALQMGWCSIKTKAAPKKKLQTALNSSGAKPRCGSKSGGRSAFIRTSPSWQHRTRKT